MIRAATLMMVIWGCGDAVVAEFRVASTDDALEGATQLVLALEQDGIVLSESEHPAAFDALRLSELPFGEGFRLRLDAFAGPFLIARGRSLPFDVDVSGPSRDPDIWFAPLGRFSTPTGEMLDGMPATVAAQMQGAWIATDAGTIYQWQQHGADGEPALSVLARDPSLAGASWAARHDALLALVDDELLLLTPQPVSRIMLTGHGGAAVVESRGEHVIVAGGESRRASMLRIGPASLELEREATLPCDVRNAPAAIVPVTIPEDGVRLVTLCTDSRTLVELDLDTGDTTMLELDTSVEASAFTSIGPGLLLITGGRDGGATARTHIVTVEDRLLVELAPAPEPLFRARSGHRAITLRPGLALVVGGRDDAGPVEAAELVAFPGDVVLTDSVGFDRAEVRAAVLDDGSVLVASRDGSSLWIVPR